MPESCQPPINWNEEMTRLYLDFGRYFTPNRAEQFQLLSNLIPHNPHPFHVLELGCGDGLLARQVLAAHPQAFAHLLDGSPGMLARAQQNLEEFQGRFCTGLFSLQESAWRQPGSSVHALPGPAWAILTSLTVHHLNGPDKKRLYQDLHGLLAPGGALLIADIVLPASPQAMESAAASLDLVVEAQALTEDGNQLAFEIFQREHWNIFRYPDDMDMPSPVFDQLEWLSQAGFQQVDVFWLKAGHAVFGGIKP